MKALSFFLLLGVLCLSACGDEAATGPSSGAKNQDQAAQPAAAEESSDQACGQGGAACPAGLECVTFRKDQEMCVPEAIQAVVLVKDATMGGSCLMATAKDSLPGISIASVEVLKMDRSLAGRGRLAWDKEGFEVAASHGPMPDGTVFTGDVCTDSYNLGCDGTAVFEIVDDSGAVLMLREGQHLVVRTRGKESCGEEFTDGVDALVCLDPGAAVSGDLDSCTWPVPLESLDAGQFGPDHFGGTLGTAPRQ